MSEHTNQISPQAQLLDAVKAILAYDGMAEFINNDDPTAAYGILTADLAALKAAVDAVEAQVPDPT